jgi:apolipoprotein N-acyltransferase
MLRPTRRNVLLLCLLSGVLWTLAWPATYTGWLPLAFVAWLPMLWAERLHDIRTEGRVRAFAPYALCGLVVWNAATTWWLGAVTAPFATQLFTGLGPTLGNTLLMTLVWNLKRMVRRRAGPVFAPTAFILFWLAFEHLHFDWDLTWPWLTLGNVFAEDTVLVQWYAFTGVEGGSLWLLLVNQFLFATLAQWKDGSVKWRRSTALTVGTLMPPVALSLFMLNTYRPKGEAVEVVVVQPGVDPYSEKYWSDPLVQLDSMLALAGRAMTDSTRMVVLPETALQEPYAYDVDNAGRVVLSGLWENHLDRSRSGHRIAGFLKDHPRVSVLAGMSSAYLFEESETPDALSRALGATGRRYMPYNAAMLVRQDGSIEPYHKSKLVAFVEMMPWERYLGSLIGYAVDLGGTTGSLGTQEEREVMDPRDGRLRAAPIICYESVFGEHVAAHVRNGANLLVIMTNDGWWGTSPGYRQHLAYGRLRAIENRRDIARSANTGISCAIDQLGRVHEASPWWEPTALRLSLLANDRLTFFTRFGDVIGRISVWLGWAMILFAVMQWLRGRRARASD